MHPVSRNGCMFRTDALCVHLELPQKKVKRKQYLTRTKSRVSLEIISSDALSVNTVPSEEVTTSNNALPMNVDDVQFLPNQWNQFNGNM
jgi:hypothetical protein